MLIPTGSVVMELKGRISLMCSYKDLFIKEFLKNPDNEHCEYCMNYIKCEGQNCKYYGSGRGGYIVGKDGRNLGYSDFPWDCKDLEYGDCRLMENTPCYKCIDNDYSGFEFNEKKYLNDSQKCDCWHPEEKSYCGLPVCWGTREKDPCRCGGDKAYCDYYEYNRRKQ